MSDPGLRQDIEGIIGVTLQDLQDNYTLSAAEYTKAHRRMRMLDAVDNGELWRAVGAQYPKYQILPDTNHVSYIKENILASIYSVGKCATIIPTSTEDRDIVNQINIMLDYIWAHCDIPMYQLRAGERAALLNLGVTQVGWDNDFIESVGKSDKINKGIVRLKNINPLRYMRDPYADSIDTAKYCMVWDSYHETFLLRNPHYREKFRMFLLEKEALAKANLTMDPSTDKSSNNPNTNSKYYNVFTHWVRTEEGVQEIHTLENGYVLYAKANIKPDMFPIAELYCNLPNKNVVGCSEPAKIFANSLAYNLMNSIILTADYKNQRPPKFVSQASGLNVSAFTKHGNDADRTFLVAGDASKTVHYHQFPTPSMTTVQSMAVLKNDVKDITGVDDRYTGRDTGSITTTGGVANMLAQVTMIDATRIQMYESYTKRLTKLVLSNLVTHSMAREYYIKDPKTNKYTSVSVDFESIDDKTIFDYEVAISSYLPKNKAAIQNMANNLMQMQMQYGMNGNTEVDLITPQEWLTCQDLPMAELMTERMGLQRSLNWQNATAHIVEQYTSLVEQGVDPSTAVEATADTMAAQQDPSIQGDGTQQAAETQQVLYPEKTAQYSDNYEDYQGGASYDDYQDESQ